MTAKTGDLQGGGTDAAIFLTLFGEKGTSKEIELNEDVADRRTVRSTSALSGPKTTAVHLMPCPG